MKDYVQLIAVFAAVLLLIPCVSYAKKSSEAKENGAQTEGDVKLLIEESGEIESLTLREYIIGAVFAQMPADFELEALKAQAVLAATYIERRKLTEQENATSELKGAYISDNTEKYQAYFSEDQAREVYASGYDEAYEKIEVAAEYAEVRLLTYGGEPIMPAFHGISFGRTESAFSMWGEDVPYLQSEDSGSDEALSESVQEIAFSESEIKELLESEFTAEDFEQTTAEEWIKAAESTEWGTVLKVKICEGVYDAQWLCELLGLMSQHFEVALESGEFTFKVKGCGHLVGMSQYGANEMAKAGSTCEEILLHYFRDTEIVKK